MDILTRLNAASEYSTSKLQLILGAWVLGTLFERRNKVCQKSGDISEDDYDKRSIYSLLYSLYRSVGIVQSDLGQPYEMTFNTWGYAWPTEWGPSPTTRSEPQRFGKNAYTGLFHFEAVKEYVREREGRVHVVEMGCGTGAGAHHVCAEVLPECTYNAVDMQQTAIETCRRKFVPLLGGRLVATHADCTSLAVASGSADIVAVCETHVTEHDDRMTEEDELFFRTAQRILQPGGFLLWGNAIPDRTWQRCFDFLESMGMQLEAVEDVTELAIAARDQDEARVCAFVEQCIDRFAAFRIPVLGKKKRQEASLAMKNFYRNPGTNLYATMHERHDTYRVVALKKVTNAVKSAKADSTSSKSPDALLASPPPGGA